MSKLSELRILQHGRSVDAPIQYHHRSGDEDGSGASRLDLYAHTDSAEDMALETEDVAAKAQFIKGFSGYLRKVFSRTEREFLKRMMSGRETPQEVGRALGVDWFKFMQNIQRRAYKNIKPLVKLVSLTGWSQGDYFVKMIMKRLSLLEDGAELAEILPKSHADRRKAREEMKAQRLAIAAERKREARARTAAWVAANRESVKAYQKAYEAANREKVTARKAAWSAAHSKAYQRVYRAANREKVKAYQRAYRAAHREKVKAYQKAYNAAHREEIKAQQAAYNAAHREELKAKKAAYKAAYRAANKENKEKEKAYNAAYKAAHREEIKAQQAIYRAAHREELNARKKERRRAAKLAAEQGNV